ncbi:acyltransferase domain-containing protein [Nocardia jejuensis]|uniref:acyltransferase domain-containing protein n=1 Tax=Nocardia jejuensis TaxID=328049 RepID=UPI000834B0E9|nr:acyltransferase domain-containing protein [Nocardia jejuensis]
MAIVGVGCRATGTQFDHEWFGIGALEAAGMSPRLRANLEVAVEALDDSGLGFLARGSNAAVVFGAGGATNSAHQLSRALDLRGPSLTVDSERDSPLVAVDMGVRLLADPGVPFVIAGGVDLALLPDISDLHTPETHSPDALCTVVVLQRTADAERTGTRRYAEIVPTGLGFPDTGGKPARIALHDALASHRSPGLGSPPAHSDDPPVLIPLTGRDPAALRELALQWSAAVFSYRTLHEFSAATSRLTPEATRATVLAHTPGEAAAQLRVLARRISAAATTSGIPRPIPAPSGREAAQRVPAHAPGAVECLPTHDAVQSVSSIFRPYGASTMFSARRPGSGAGGVLLLFSGGGGHPRMGRALAARYPVFGRAVTEAADAVVTAGGPRVWTPRHGFTNHGESGSGWESVSFAHPALFVFQVAMAELLGSWGVRTSGVAGYGAGEVAAAVVSGALSMADGARVAIARARVLARAEAPTAAAVLEATPAEVARLVEPMRADVGVAAIDGPRSITVSGDPRYIDALVRRAHRRAIFAQRIADPGGEERATGRAVPHMPVLRALAPQLTAELAGIASRAAELTFYSTTHHGTRFDGSARHTPGPSEAVGSSPAGERMDAGYWGANLAGPVDLAAALEGAVRDGVSTVVEVGAQAVLMPAVREFPMFRDATHPVGSREDEPAALLRALANLYTGGHELDWTAIGPFTTAPPQRLWRRTPSSLGSWEPDGQSASEETMPPPFPVVSIRPEGTYVVAGGLGTQGAVAVRWLLDQGARDVVVLTRSPRALPPPLEGMEDRIVVVRCDARDRVDLATALQDIRECGVPIRGIVHAACAPPLVSAANLLDLTAADPTDFTVLLTDPLLGSNLHLARAAVQELAAAHADRRVVCVEWQSGPAA